jgi:hypothetical protein
VQHRKNYFSSAAALTLHWKQQRLHEDAEQPEQKLLL